MRKMLVLYTATLLLPATHPARSQQAGAAGETSKARSQWLELGYRTTTVDGDKARWERYRDLSDGALVGLGGDRTTETSALTLTAANVGYRNQQYNLDFNQYGKLKLTASFSSVPLNYAYYSLTPWKNAGGNVWTLDATTRTNVQNGVAGVVGVPSNQATFTSGSAYRALAVPFPMQALRGTANVAATYRISDVASADVRVTSTTKSGNQPFGGGTAFANQNELPMELDNRTTDVAAGLEWANPAKGMLRLGWNRSWFKNQFQSLTWESPLRATDYSNGLTPPSGPYNPSAYSNGLGAARDRLALPPSNSLSSFNVQGLYKMPNRTTLSGNLAFTTAKQDEQLIPWTTNSVILSSTVYAAFPKLAALPRTSAQAEVQGVNALLNFGTRPTNAFGFDIRYRFNDHKELTPIFDGSQYVRLDGVPYLHVGAESEHYNIRQNTMETGATFTPLSNSTVRLGYILDDVKREGRSFSNMADYTARLSVDSYRLRLLTVRAIYEDTRRKGDGFSESALEDGGFQPGLRFYDEADMHRKKGMLILQSTPIDVLTANVTVAANQDRFGGEGHEFGLLQNDSRSLNFSVDFSPMDNVTLGGNFADEKFSTQQRARNANPPATPPAAYESWLDPNRDWILDNDETVKNIGLYAEVSDLLPKTELKLSFDRNTSDNPYVYSGPRIQELTTNVALTAGDSRPCGATSTPGVSCFAQLPVITNAWNQVKADVKYTFSRNLRFTVSYLYDKLDISDYATVNLPDGSPRIDLLGAINTGYGNRPYSGSAVMVRVAYTY